MQHIDQKLLELYVLNDETILPQRDMIERHLNECAGCRELVARMEDMYAGFFESMETKPLQTQSSLPVRQKKSLTIASPSPLQEIRANYEIERAPMRRVMLFVRRHPVVSSTMSLFVLGFFALLGFEVFKAIENIDENPSYYRYSPDSKLEIYNKENKLLWSIPGNPLTVTASAEQARGIYRTQILDLQGDGINEVLTSAQVGATINASPLTLKIFDNRGKLTRTFTFNDKHISFRNNHYDTEFLIGYLFASRMSQNTLNLFILANNGRSPNFIARVDSNLNIIGRYWHFGNLVTSGVYTQFHGNKKRIVAGGINDVEDEQMREFPVLVILDPEKIYDNTESSLTRGFGLPQSTAEEYYIRFPETDMEKTTKTKSGVMKITYEDTTLLGVKVENFEIPLTPNYVGFEYFLSKKDLRIVDVKFFSSTQRTHQRLLSEGKIHSTFGRQYLEDLKKRVEYWDGEKWSRKPVRIKHQTENSFTNK